jgi:phosphatidylserine decarboxylase
VVKIDHIKGGFKPAFNKESEHNERVITVLATRIGKVKIIQIAGIVARRIVPYITERQRLLKGEKIGMIRFGSRVDLYLPSDKLIPEIVPGQKVRAGIDTIGILAD